MASPYPRMDTQAAVAANPKIMNAGGQQRWKSEGGFGIVTSIEAGATAAWEDIIFTSFAGASAELVSWEWQELLSGVRMLSIWRNVAMKLTY